MKKTFLYAATAALSLLLVLPACAQKKNVLTNGEDKAKLVLARQAYYAGFEKGQEEFVKALNLYKEVQSSNPNDGSISFHIGECYFQMEQYDDALASFEKAKSLDPNCELDLNLMLGRTYHVKGEIDKAVDALTAYKNSVTGNKKKIEESEIDHYLLAAQTAKELMAKPLSVTITPLGSAINSPYDDKRPSISADGKTMIFTSRRPEGKTSQVDKLGDGKYFDDIYASTWDETKQTWGEAEILKGSINTEGHDAACSISPDGKQLFVYVNNDDYARGGDIFVSKRGSSGKWGSPTTLGKPVNTSYFEDGGCLSADGNTLYFISENPKGGAQGRGDIWMAKRISKTEWGKPVNLGADINTPYDEGGIFIHPDGKTLYFSSEGHNSMGGYDIFKTTWEGGKWTKPVNLGYPINTINNEKVFLLSTNGKTGYIDSDREGGLGDRDIFMVDMSPSLPKDSLPAGPALSILKGNIYDGDGKGVEAKITIYDENGAEVGNTNSSPEGDYFITLLGDRKYQVKATLKGYKEVSELVDLPAAKDAKSTYELVKHFILYKDK